MSDFPGILPEIPGLSVDKFDEENCNSSVYLLSHCHFDHMRGIDDEEFLENLFQRPEVFIYMSEVSAQILKGLKPNLSLKIKPLPTNISTLIKVPSVSNSFINITLIPAGHCPGSVMFLLETDKIILYTGDFRARVSDLKKYSAFYSLNNPNNPVKKISKVYLDTTFFDKNYLNFPSREDVLQELCHIIKEWLEGNKEHVVFLQRSAHIGYENLYIELYKRLKIPIHVSLSSMEFYKYVPEMDRAVTLDENTRIHACQDSNPDRYQAMCRTCINKIFNRRTIKLSAQRWTKTERNSKDGHLNKLGSDYYFLCYSTHASYEEIRDFMLFLQPDEIEACVWLRNENKIQMMQNLIDEIMSVYKNKIDEKNKENAVKLLSINKATNKVKLKMGENANCELMKLLEAGPPLKKHK